jgi:hypothetical protein
VADRDGRSAAPVPAREEVKTMGTQSEIARLAQLRETEANRQGQIDQQMKNLQANQLDEAARNAGYLAVRSQVQR